MCGFEATKMPATNINYRNELQSTQRNIARKPSGIIDNTNEIDLIQVKIIIKIELTFLRN